MIDTIWHLRGSTQLEGYGPDALIMQRVEHLLKRQRKALSQRGAENVAFDAPLWIPTWGSNWDAMVIYDRGRFWIEHNARGRILFYELRSLHGFIFCVCAAAMFFAVGMGSAGFSQGLTFGTIAFGWLYGMNMLLAWLRIPSAIRKAVCQP